MLTKREEDTVTAATEPEAAAAAPPAEVTTRRDHVPLGIIYMVGATAAFAISSAVSKWLAASYPVGEVLFTRTAIAFLSCALFVLPQSGFAVYRTKRLGQHVMRSASQTVSQTFLIIAFSLMPLASVIAINFSAPLFATLVSAIVLKEAVGLSRGSALVVGFLGVLIVTNPGAETFQIGALFALANAMLYGSVTAGVRGMTATESANTLTMYQLTLMTISFAAFLPFGFTTPTWPDFWLMVLNGTSNAIGQYWWTRSLHLAPTAAVSPFFYMSLVWAMMFGFLIWGDVPTLGLLAGSAIVIGSGLFLLWHETAKKR